jgi:hypothetical protein
MEIILPESRISFEVLGVPRAYQDKPDQPRRWGSTFLIPQGSPLAAEVLKAITEVATAKWDKKAKLYLEDILADKKASCWVNGDKKEYDGYQGMMALTAYRYEEKGRMIVLDSDASPMYKPDGSLHEGKGGRIYSGCYVKAKVDIYAQDNKQGKGIRAELKVVQRLRNGDAFGGGTPPTADGFEAVEEGADADDLS